MSRIRHIQQSLSRSMILVTHDVGLVAENCDTVAVMSAGTIVEQGASAQILREPNHPYTRTLLAAIPRRRARPAAAAGHQAPPSPHPAPTPAGDLR